MEKAIKVFVIMSMIIAAVSFSACNKQNGYDINNYTIVYSENGTVEYQNYGAGTTEKTVYELASNGKTVAAVVALKMVDDGLLPRACGRCSART